MDSIFYGNYGVIVKVNAGNLFDSQEFTITVSEITTESYIISTFSGPNGSINPSGNVTVRQGHDQTFYITPGDGYQIEEVIVDSISVGAVNSYTFNNVVTNHSIYADFIEEVLTIQPPIADFNVNGASDVVPLQVYFDTSNSYHLDRNIVICAWDFKDGSTGTGQTINHTFSSSGSYSVMLTVTDDKGATDSTTKEMKL